MKVSKTLPRALFRRAIVVPALPESRASSTSFFSGFAFALTKNIAEDESGVFGECYRDERAYEKLQRAYGS
jgi:hypothetical protein